ncbi:MAG TPA: cation diffusion facilitator family transporter [Micromonosporaceae bacterium]|jgi:cobalt-zinc-cadmium efflux system protein|nr:cation diffusion facilitator family transporter [Micromonosporaceae bacterium]
MSAGHDHGPGAARAGARHRGRLWASFLLLAAFMLVEAGAAWYTGSLALLSDAAHMFTDVLGIGMALAAIHVASRTAGVRADRTFGLYRVEVLAALANAVLLFGVALYVLVEAVRRLAEPREVLAGPMLVVAAAGLAANLVAFALLRSGARESLNVRGAYLEVLGDLLGSVGVLLAAAVIQLTGWWYADPIIAVAVGLFILPRTWALGRAAVRVLVQAAPAHVDVAEVQRTLAGLPGVCDVHDLHVWTLTSGMDVASAHLSVDSGADLAGVLATARGALHSAYGIEHATLQVEPVDAAGACGPVW